MKESTRKKPMTTEELFDKINGILKEKGKLPDILDYSLATHSPVPITNYEFEIRNNLDYGGNEGIYLDLGIEYNEDGKKQRKGLGTYKTLGTDDEDMRIMAGLLADFIVEEYKYVNANLDDFTWEGADVSYVDESGKYHPGWSCRTMEVASWNRGNGTKNGEAGEKRSSKTGTTSAVPVMEDHGAKASIGNITRSCCPTTDFRIYDGMT